MARLSRRELSERSGVSAEAIQGIERNGAEPSLETARKLARSLNVPIELLFEEKEPDG